MGSSVEQYKDGKRDENLQDSHSRSSNPLPYPYLTRTLPLTLNL